MILVKYLCKFIMTVIEWHIYRKTTGLFLKKKPSLSIKGTLYLFVLSLSICQGIRTIQNISRHLTYNILNVTLSNRKHKYKLE